MMTTTDKTPTLRAQMFARAFRDELRPHRLMKTVAGVVWETISYPWAEGDVVRVMIRVPGDATTIIEVDAFDLDPEQHDCYCATAGDFYFRESDEDAARRARNVEWLTRPRAVSSFRTTTLDAQVDALKDALRRVILNHCPNERLYCGSCTDARKLLDELGAPIPPRSLEGIR